VPASRRISSAPCSLRTARREGAADQPLEHLLAPEYDDVRRRELLDSLQVPEHREAILQQLNQLRESAYYRRLDETGRRRLQGLLPRLLRALVRLPMSKSRWRGCCTCSSALAAERCTSRC
jgi:glutamine synthetase adenylyltransferase